MKNRKLITTIVAFLVLVLIGLMAALIYVRVVLINKIGSINSDKEKYSYHYVLITDTENSTFWSHVYDGAYAYGVDHDAYVEVMGDGLAVNYSRNELLEIAIDSNVDGIILEGDDSEEQDKLINKAVDSGIPVITMVNDSYGSTRLSFVGIGPMALGRDYARAAIRIADKESDNNVVILGDDVLDGTVLNLFSEGFDSTMESEGNHLSVNTDTMTVASTDSVSSQETLRDLFIVDDEASLPDIVICTNENITTSVYQDLVDYNLVGKVKVIGYYSSDTVLEAIDKGVISATIVLDGEEMGNIAAQALDDYHQYGRVNSYITIESQTITKENLQEQKEYEQSTE